MMNEWQDRLFAQVQDLSHLIVPPSNYILTSHEFVLLEEIHNSLKREGGGIRTMTLSRVQ